MGIFASRFDPVQDLPDLTGRVAIVTGANAGIGIFTVLHLARRGAKVYLGARDQSKAEAAIARLQLEGLGSAAGEIVWLDLNLSDPRTAIRAARTFISLENRLDILVNNAGKIISPYGLTADGISDSFVINHLSPAAFTTALLPLMKATAMDPEADVRIVNLSSMAHRWIKDPRYKTFESINSDFSSTRNPKTSLYAYTKLANILWTAELQRRFDTDGVPIIVTAVHPGSVLSEGNVNLFSSLPMGKLLVWIAKIFFVSSDVGAYTSAFAAASVKVREDREKYKGKYIVPYGKVETPSVDAQDAGLAKDLWDSTEELLAKFKFD